MLLIGEWVIALGSIVTTAGEADLSSSLFKMSTLKHVNEILLGSLGGGDLSLKDDEVSLLSLAKDKSSMLILFGDVGELGGWVL